MPKLTQAEVNEFLQERGHQEGEAYTGIWHKRYYEAGSRVRQQVETGGAAASGSQLKIG